MQQSLNGASQSPSTFSVEYSNSPLHEGFFSWYPGNYGGFEPGWYSGAMKVYGHSGLPLVW